MTELNTRKLDRSYGVQLIEIIRLTKYSHEEFQRTSQAFASDNGNNRCRSGICAPSELLVDV
jgi:hypothetical protein